MPSTATVPTSLRGKVSDGEFATLMDELVVDLPTDLQWPSSITTYATMRREARLSSILSAWTLQLRRAQWQLDPAGCRPEVVALAADDLGLPVAGRDEPGAARVRGVSWNEHLRVTLASLTYGHYGFELEADVSSGRARLSGLFERPPWTIGDIHADPASGAFLGVTQNAPTGGQTTPQIGADRMVWYAREREGANWAGTSLLRASFPAWLIKREMIKVYSTANRRFGMGVPVMEALPGTQPTGSQMSEAMEMASAARVGDQSGAASPPGFTFKLVGLTGSVPNTLDFLKWLNGEMSRAALVQHLDLGSTESGSRALAGEFIDSWLLALEAEAEHVADVATRQAVARVVGWNFGEDEPVPRVVVSGIGSRREVTAESLKLLLDSGGLSSDPGLESWIRREYRLPEREGMPRPAPSTDTVGASAGRKRAPRRPRKEASGQLALPVMAAATSREPTDLEQQSGADFDAIREDIEAAQQALAEQWPDLSEAMIAALVAAVVAAVAAGALDDLGSLVVPDEALAGIVAALGASMLDLAVVSAERAVDELRGQGADVETGEPDEGRLSDAADAFAGVIGSGYATGAGRVALQHAGPDADADAVGAAVREHLDSLSEVKDGGPGGWVATNLGGALAQAVAAGRAATFDNAPTGWRWLISAINDRNLCDRCADDDQRVFDSLAAALEVMPAGGNKACLGGVRCRCALVAIAPNAGQVEASMTRVMAHLPGKHEQKTHGNRFNTPGDKSSGLRERTPRTGRTRTRSRGTGTGTPSSELGVGQKARAADFARWREQASKPGVRREGGTTQRKKRLAELQAELDEAVERRDRAVEREREKLKRKRMSQAAKDDLVRRATGQEEADVNLARGALQAVRDMPEDPDYFDKMVDTIGVPAQDMDPSRPLASYGDMIHMHDESDATHKHMLELEAAPPEIHDVIRGYLAEGDRLMQRPGGIFLGDSYAPDLDDLGHLRGQPTRGAEQTDNRTMDQVAGLYKPDRRVIAIGNEDHGSTAMALHELGHGADAAVGAELNDGGLMSKEPQFADVFRLLPKQRMRPYYTQPNGIGESETWAEGFAAWGKARAAGADPGVAIAATLGKGIDVAFGQMLAGYFQSVMDRLAEKRGPVR